ncbi:MAG: TraR/DksA C4-type zinc finger protein [bacterium]|nr:TraR/DksA C4-type zinc finger protein [bacterium]MDT8395567.1 TraR/DksA C4-type zinc finger protein [bacterium]
MDAKKLEKFKKKLLEMRLDLVAELYKVTNGEMNKERPGAMDSVDMADSSYAADTSLARTEKINHRIREVDGAIYRIKNGNYGICEMCGEDIPEGRLDVRPNALYCAQCKEDLEKRGEIK